MKILIFIIFTQDFFSLYEYYSNRLKNIQILNKSLKFNLNFFNSIDFEANKRFPFFYFFFSYYNYREFNSFSFCFDLFKKRVDTTISLDGFFRSANNYTEYFQDIKFNYLINFEKLKFFFNLKFPLFYEKKFKEFLTFDEELVGDLYFENLKTGSGIKFLKKFIYYIYYIPEIKSFYLPFYLYLNKNKIYPSFNILYLSKNFFFKTGFLKKVNFFNSIREHKFIFETIPFIFENTESQINSLLYSQMEINFERIFLNISYKKFFDNYFDVFFLEGNSFYKKKTSKLELTSFEFVFFNRIFIKYQNFSDNIDLFFLKFKIIYKNFMLEPEGIYFIKDKFIVNKFKGGYIYNKKYYVYIQYNYVEKEVFPLKKEVKFGIQKRF